MKVYEASDFADCLNLLPSVPGNEAVRNRLMEMMAEQKVIRQPYTFEVEFSTGTGANLRAGAFAALVPGNTGIIQGNFQVDSSSPFMLVAGAQFSDIAGAAQTSGTLIVPGCTVNMQDQSSGRFWMNSGIPIPNLFGSGQAPFYWPQPRLIPANSTILVQAANYEAANTYNVRLSFIGWRYYAVGQ